MKGGKKRLKILHQMTKRRCSGVLSEKLVDPNWTSFLFRSSRDNEVKHLSDRKGPNPTAVHLLLLPCSRCWRHAESPSSSLHWPGSFDQSLNSLLRLIPSSLLTRTSTSWCCCRRAGKTTSCGAICLMTWSFRFDSVKTHRREGLQKINK